MERLRKAGKDLVYRYAKQHSEPASDRRGPRAGELTGRIAAMAQAAPSQPVKVPAERATAGCDVPTQPEPAPPKRSQAHYRWAVLIARIYEVFPLLCPLCGGQMRIQ
jgi:hypothetical protein